MKLSKAIEGFLLFKRSVLSKSTIEGYEYAFKRLQDYFPSDPEIEELTPNNIIAFMNCLRETPQEIKRGIAARQPIVLSGKSRLNIHTALSSLWTWATENGFAQQHIIRRVPRPKPEKRAIVPFSREDVVELLKGCESYSYQRDGKTITVPRITALRDKAIIKLLVDTGIRASELCGLRISDLDTRNHRFKVMGKGSKERILRISPRTTQAIWHYLTTRENADSNEPLFANHKRITFMTRRNLLTLLSRIGESVGVRHAHPHRFRHTFAINFLRNGGNIYALQEMLGHASLDMCKRYLAIAQADTEAAHRKASPVSNWRL